LNYKVKHEFPSQPIDRHSPELNSWERAQINKKPD